MGIGCSRVCTLDGAVKNENVQTVFSCVDVSRAGAWQSHVTDLLEVVLLCHMDNVSSAQIHQHANHTKLNDKPTRYQQDASKLNPPPPFSLLPPRAYMIFFRVSCR